MNPLKLFTQLKRTHNDTRTANYITQHRTNRSDRHNTDRDTPKPDQKETPEVLKKSK